MAQPFQVGGWALDHGAPAGTGVDSVQVYAFPNPGSGQAGILLGSTYGLARADVGAAFGGRFTNTGYNAVANSLPAGTYLIGVYAHSTVSGNTQLSSVTVNVTGGPAMFLDQPGAGAVLQQPFTMGGWALDGAAASGTGVDTIHVWAYPNPGSGAAPVFVGVAQYRWKPTRCRRSVWQPIQQFRIQRLSPRPCAKRVSVGRVRAQYRNRNVQSVPIGGGDGSELTRHGARHAVCGKPSPALYGGGMGDRRRLDLRHRRRFRARLGVSESRIGPATDLSRRRDLRRPTGRRRWNLRLTIRAKRVQPRRQQPHPGVTYDIAVFARSTVSNSFDIWRVVRVTSP